MINIFLKIRKKGLRWLFNRLINELTNPKNSLLKFIIDNILNINYHFSKKNTSSQYLYAIYDLDISPITFNIVEYLQLVERELLKLNMIGFVIVFVPKKENALNGNLEYDKIIDSDSLYWKIENILVQTSKLHPKCKGVVSLPDRASIKNIINQHVIYPNLYDGINIRFPNLEDFWKEFNSPGMFTGLKASHQGLKYIKQFIDCNNIDKKIITIVIRQYDYDKSRNSNLIEWNKFINYLIKKDYYPIIIPDTDNAFIKNLPFPEKYIFRDCCWNVGLRIALFELSFLIFGGPNGPMALAIHNTSCSFILMNMLPEGSSVTTKESYKRIGYEIGENWRFLNEKQKISYLPDNFENIKLEFELFEKFNTN